MHVGDAGAGVSQRLQHGAFTMLAQFGEQRAVQNFNGQHAGLESHRIELGEDDRTEAAFERVGDLLKTLESSEGFAAE